MTTTNPIVAMNATEAKLITSINAASAAMDKVATTPIAQAIERLHASAEAAKSRIVAAKADLYATIADVLHEIAEFDADIIASLELNEQTPIMPQIEHTPTAPVEPNAIDELAKTLSQIDAGDDETIMIGIPSPATEVADQNDNGTVVAVAANGSVGEPEPADSQAPHTSGKAGKKSRKRR